MTNNIKTAFDCIHAEEKLKASTSLYLQREIQKRSRVRRHTPRFAAAIACVFILILTAAFSYNLYFTPVTYVDLDINPSVGLMINKFDRVIGVQSYNNDGENLLPGLSLSHKNYKDALAILLEAITHSGYIKDGGLISVTLQTDSLVRESVLLANIRTGIDGVITEHRHRAQVDVVPISSDMRSHAHVQGLSPAKYLAIQELIEVDPNMTVDTCRNHSISEIKQLTQNHIDNHHGSENNTTHEANDYTSDDDCQGGNSDHHGDGHH